jgi:hypothetical protein
MEDRYISSLSARVAVMKSSARCEADRPTMVKDEGRTSDKTRSEKLRRQGGGGGRGPRAALSKRQKVSQS